MAALAHPRRPTHVEQPTRCNPSNERYRQSCRGLHLLPHKYHRRTSPWSQRSSESDCTQVESGIVSFPVLTSLGSFWSLLARNRRIWTGFGRSRKTTSTRIHKQGLSNEELKSKVYTACNRYLYRSLTASKIRKSSGTSISRFPIAVWRGSNRARAWT